MADHCGDGPPPMNFTIQQIEARVIARHFYEKGKADALEGALDAIDGLTRVPGAMLTPYEEGREEALQEAMSVVVEDLRDGLASLAKGQPEPMQKDESPEGNRA